MPFHIHVPKPLHGWKAFFNEIFVIVIGVLIALGFEQVVEWAHWQHKVAEGEELLIDEAQRNYGSSLEAYVVAPCIDAQIEMVRRNLLQPEGSRQPLPSYSDAAERFVIKAPNRPLFAATWQSLIADGTLNHMEVGRFGLWGAYYQGVEKQQLVSQQTLEQAGGLMTLASSLPLSEESRARYLDRLDSLSIIARRNRAVAIRVVEWHQKLGLDTPAARVEAFLSKALTPTFCSQHGYPLADWRKAIDDKLPPSAM